MEIIFVAGKFASMNLSVGINLKIDEKCVAQCGKILRFIANQM